MTFLTAPPLNKGAPLAAEANASDAGRLGDEMSDIWRKGLQATELLLVPALDC